MTLQIINGDSLEVLATLPENSIDAVVTDPPYGLSNTDPAHVAETIGRWLAGERDFLPSGKGFMGKEWDGFVPPPALWDECLRVLKPGGHVLAFAGSRTMDLMSLGLRLAGFDIRDSVAWLYGSGFPKSMDLGKKLPKWEGWGTALKPAHEPVVCARKPFNAVPLESEASRLHHLIGALLWLSLSPAKRAELTSLSSQAEPDAAWCASALASAATATSPGESARTDTYSSPALASTFSSIVTSWSSILGALSGQTRTSTISTRSSTTTDLRTLNSLLAPLTSQTTMPPCACLQSGSSSPASSAASASTDEWANWLRTLSASVPASATEGIALVVESVLARAAAELSDDQEAGSSADPSATTGAAGGSSPAFEPIVVARKPFKGTVAANVLEHGTGALNIDASRIKSGADYHELNVTQGGDHFSVGSEAKTRGTTFTPSSGRFPANVILDEHTAALLSGITKSSGHIRSNTATAHNKTASMGQSSGDWETTGPGDSGGASRFFYCAKAPKSERPVVDGVAHPTVKPLSLMRYLITLVTPPGGVVLEPFAGSGTTVEAALMDGFGIIAMERDETYLPLIQARIDRYLATQMEDLI